MSIKVVRAVCKFLPFSLANPAVRFIFVDMTRLEPNTLYDPANLSEWTSEDSRRFIAAGGLLVNQKALSKVMRELGRRTSPAKAAAARRNGKLGGRPRGSSK